MTPTQARCINGLILIRIFGEPQTMPKKQVKKFGRRLVPVDIDFRTRKNPITGAKEEYDHGYKTRWLEHVRTEVVRSMIALGIKPFPKDRGIAWGSAIIMTRPKSCQLEDPASGTDDDNYDYPIRNYLKKPAANSQKNAIIKRLYPNGIMYDDDDQIVYRIEPAGKFWAHQFRPPGVLIQVRDFGPLREYANRKLDLLLKTVAEGNRL